MFWHKLAKKIVALSHITSVYRDCLNGPFKRHKVSFCEISIHKVFNQTQWHESNVKQQVWDAFIIYAKMAWKRVMEHIKISSFSKEALLRAGRSLSTTRFTHGLELEETA